MRALRIAPNAAARIAKAPLLTTSDVIVIPSTFPNLVVSIAILLMKSSMVSICRRSSSLRSMGISTASSSSSKVLSEYLIL